MPGERRDLPLQRVLDIIDTAGRLRCSSVIVAGGDRPEDVELVETARDHGIVERIILVGDRKKILETVKKLGIDIPEKDMIHAEGHEAVAAETVRVALEEDIEILLKGGVPTGIISREMLKLANRPTASIVTLLDASSIAGGRPLLLSDPGLTTITNFGRLTGIIRNAVDVAKAVLGIERPRVAVLNAYEGLIPTLPSTAAALKLAGLDWPDADVCGPLSFDLATSMCALEMKGLPKLPNADKVAGRADILICPNIETGNVLYKSIAAQESYGDASLANIAVGFEVAYGIMSRADSLEVRLASIAFCSVFAQRTREKPHPLRHTHLVRGEALPVLSVLPGLEGLTAALFAGGRCIWEDVFPLEADVPPPDVQWDRQIDLWSDQVLAGVETSSLRPAAVACGGGVVREKTERICGHVFKADVAAAKKAGAPASLFNRLELVEAGGAVHLGVPLIRRLAEALDVLPLAVQPAEFSAEAWETLRTGDRKIMFREWLAPAALRDAADRIGLPVETLSVVLAHGAEDITVMSVEGDRVGEARVTILDMDAVDKTGLTEERALQVAAPVVLEIENAFAEKNGHVHAVILTGELVRNTGLGRAVRKSIGGLAPILIFEGRPDARSTALAAQEALAFLQAKSDPGSKRK